jgi:hypothetical protein
MGTKSDSFSASSKVLGLSVSRLFPPVTKECRRSERTLHCLVAWGVAITKAPTGRVEKVIAEREKSHPRPRRTQEAGGIEEQDKVGYQQQLLDLAR